MTNRELLELAAKAAGYEIATTLQAEREASGHGHAGLYIKSGSTCWNPLTSDSDAFCLAVRLKLSVKHGVEIWDDKKQMSAYAYLNDGSHDGWSTFVPHGRDPYAATRLAIVQAAAEMGRSMESEMI